MTSTILETPTKSETDKKDYRLIRLSNGLKVLLIKTAHNDKEGEAPKEKMAALAISVAVGGNHDPKEIKGLSHFLEHMVFMGSEKYPGENDFMQYLTNEGGSTNAFTTTEHTVFFFDSNEDAFVGAVDRLSQFFIAPLLLKDSVDRELESVESEYQMGVNSSYRRKIRIMLSLTHEDHQVNSFTIGNSTTLRNNTTVDEVYKNLDEHREKYYVANRMTLCIQTNYELDKMQELVEEYFVAIKSGDPAPVYDDNEYLNIFRAEFHEKMIYIKPLDTKNELTLTWILPHILRNYKCLANTYIENVFDYDGPGSLASYLKEKLLVIKFEAGSSEESNYSFFTLSLVLTSHGLQNIDEIMEAISSYCYLLQQTSMEDHEKLFNNIKELMDVDFKYAKENTEVNNVIMHSMRINFFPDEDILIGGRSFVKFDGAAISEIINILNDTKFNVLLMTKDYDNFDKKEKWYGTEYASVDIPEKYVQFWNEKKINPALKMPALNPFICSNFDIHEKLEPTDFPVIVLKNDICEVWHKLDDQFKLPEGFINVQLKSPKAISTVNNSILLDLYQQMMKFYLDQKLYSAEKASLKYKVKLIDQELHIMFSGYSEKLEQIVDIVTKEMKDYAAVMDEKIFENIKKRCNQTYHTSILETDLSTNNYMKNILKTKHFTEYEMYNKMDNLKFDDLKEFMNSYFNQLKIRILVQGNLTKDHAMSIGNMVMNNLSAGRVIDASEIEVNCRQIKVGNTCLKIKAFMNNEKTTATKCYYEIGAVDIRLLCLMNLMVKVIEEPLFDNLRTKEQLGYSVWCQLSKNSGILGLYFILYSVESKHSSDLIRARIENFVVHDLKKVIDEMTDEQFDTIKNAQIKMKNVADVDLYKELKRNWSEITNDQFIFNHRAIDADILKTFTKADLTNLYYSKINTIEARKLTVQVIGNSVEEIGSNDEQQLKLQLITANGDDQSSCETIITDIEEYKRNLIVHPYMVVKI